MLPDLICQSPSLEQAWLSFRPRKAAVPLTFSLTFFGAYYFWVNVAQNHLPSHIVN